MKGKYIVSTGIDSKLSLGFVNFQPGDCGYMNIARSICKTIVCNSVMLAIGIDFRVILIAKG